MSGRPKGTGGQAKKLTDSEIRRIDRCLIGTRHEIRNRAIFFLGLGSGMRISEIASLTIKDVMPHGELLEEIVLEKHSTKSKRSRTIFITQQAFEILQDYIDQRMEAEELDLNSPLFPSQKNPKKPLSPNAATKLLKKMFEDAGVGNASSHSMRRTHGDTLRRNGADLKLIQDQLGHANIQTTAIYFGISDEERKGAIRGMRFKV